MPTLAQAKLASGPQTIWGRSSLVGGSVVVKTPFSAIVGVTATAKATIGQPALTDPITVDAWQNEKIWSVRFSSGLGNQDFYYTITGIGA